MMKSRHKTVILSVPSCKRRRVSKSYEISTEELNELWHKGPDEN